MSIEPGYHHHQHEDGYADDRSRYVGSMMLTVVAVVLALVLIAALFAWSPWATGTDGRVAPGTNENQPAQEEQVPPVDGSQPSAPSEAPSEPQTAHR